MGPGEDLIWLFLNLKAILEEKPIDVFNNGKHTRDFTYIDDIIEGVIKTIDISATINVDWKVKYRIQLVVKPHGVFTILEIVIQ